MKKNIVIVVLSITTSFSTVWGLKRQIEATNQTKISTECQQIAEEQSAIAAEAMKSNEQLNIQLQMALNQALFEAEKARELAQAKE